MGHPSTLAGNVSAGSLLGGVFWASIETRFQNHQILSEYPDLLRHFLEKHNGLHVHFPCAPVNISKEYFLKLFHCLNFTHVPFE